MDDLFRTFERLGLFIFPISPEMKVPYERFKWRAQSSNDPQVWRQWAQEYPGCNWALDCGKSERIIIDIDTKHGVNGFLTWEEILGALPEDLPHTFQVVTPSNGGHIYFKSNKNLPSLKCGPGLETRGFGGYVLLPGSKTIEIKNPHGEIAQYAGEYLIKNGYDVPDVEIPQALIEKLYGNLKEKKEKFKVGEKIVGGERNTTLYRMACSLIAQNHSPEVVASAVLSTNKTVCPPLDEKEVGQILESAEKKRDNNDRPEAAEDESKGKAKKTKWIHFKNYFSAQFPERRFCPIKQELFVKTNYNVWEPAMSQDAILKSLAHENNLKHSLVTDHLAHWGSLKEKSLHENKMLIDIPEWDGKKRIFDFWASLPIQNLHEDHSWQLFQHFLANIWRRLDDPKTRNWALILVGDQNAGKDWWIRELLGGWDKRYYYENLNVFDDEIRTFMQIDGKVVINISEFDNTKKWDSAFLKDLITKEDLSYIGKYGKMPKHNDARHTIIASANKMDFLQDYTGSSRFLIFDLGEGGFIDRFRYPLGESLQVLAESRVLYENDFRASEDALKSLDQYQESVTPENIPKMIKEDFNSYLLTKDRMANNGATSANFWSIAEVDEFLSTTQQKLGKSRRQIFDILKPSFGAKSNGVKGYRRGPKEVF